MPLPNEITIVNERRKVLFEKYSPKTRIISMFLKLWDSCTIRGVGGQTATTIYLVKGDLVLFELNRTTKKIFFADHILLDIWFNLPNVDKNSVDKELFNTAVSHAIKHDLNIDVDYNYVVDRLGDYSKDNMMDFVKENSIEVSVEYLYVPTRHIDEIVDDIMNNVFEQ